MLWFHLKYSAFLPMLDFFEGRRFFFLCTREASEPSEGGSFSKLYSYSVENTRGTQKVLLFFLSAVVSWMFPPAPRLAPVLSQRVYRRCVPLQVLQSTPSTVSEPSTLPPSLPLARDSTQPSFHALVIPPGLLQHPSWLRSQSTL